MTNPQPNPVLQRHFVTVRGQFGTRQVHYRRAGQGPVVLLLHQSPQSSREMEPLMEAWGQTFTLIAPDSPGYGFSQPMQQAGAPVTAASIEDFAAATLEFVAALGIERFGVYGFHTGASIGVALAHRYPDRVTAVAANGFVVLTANERLAILRDYLPPLIPRWDGSHLAWLWGRLREQTIFFPWHDRRAATRMTFAVPGPDQLQQGLNEFLAAGDHYPVAYAAAFSDAGERRLPELRVPVLITATARDPLSSHLARIGAHSSTVEILASTDSSAALARARAHLACHPGTIVPQAGVGPVADSAPGLSGVSEYFGPPGQQIRAVRTAARTPRPGRTVVLLHPPGGSAESLRSLAHELAAHATVLALDLPGHGASDPPAAAGGPGDILGGCVAQVAAALAPLEPGQLVWAETTLMAIGSSAPLGLELAIELTAAQGTELPLILLEPPAWSAGDTADWLRHGLPALTPVWSGGHLLEAWHQVRDGRLFSPWFRREPASIRRGEPDLDDAGIQAEVRDLLRANGTWQALLGAALSYPGHSGQWARPGLVRLGGRPRNWLDVLGRGSGQ